MKFHSTRSKSTKLSFCQAMEAGLAQDGGLLVPEFIPKISWEKFKGEKDYVNIALEVLKPFFVGDPLESELGQICKQAFNFPLILKDLDSQTSMMELFHGPTSAFKDFGARFLAECFDRRPTEKPRCILVATSGDTGGAVASAFNNKNNIQVGVLFPTGKVSPRQQKQLTCWGSNIQSFSINGTFDDCQAIVKEAFQSDLWRNQLSLTSANSINIGRLLPQMTYYAASSLWHQEKFGRAPSFIIPTGNLGNAMGAIYAKQMGWPIGKLTLATNSNSTIFDYFQTGEWVPKPSVPTLANAMDVGNPSNIERFRHQFPNIDSSMNFITCQSVTDDEIRNEIKQIYKKYGEIICPHTATGFHCKKTLQMGEWIVVATAHPSKFDTVVEPIVGIEIDVPSPLKLLLDLEAKFSTIEPQLRHLAPFFLRP